MAYCVNCGTQLVGPYCGQCGTKVQSAEEASQSHTTAKTAPSPRVGQSQARVNAGIAKVWIEWIVYTRSAATAFFIGAAVVGFVVHSAWGLLVPMVFLYGLLTFIIYKATGTPTPTREDVNKQFDDTGSSPS